MAIKRPGELGSWAAAAGWSEATQFNEQVVANRRRHKELRFVKELHREQSVFFLRSGS